MSLARRAVQPAARSQSKLKSLPAPTLGWVSAQNQAAAKQGTALVLENWFPTQTGIRLIGGSRKQATVSEAGEPCESVFSYIGGTTRKLFGAAEGNIFDITSPADVDLEPTPDVTGQTDNYYATVNYSTVGGNFLYACNDADAPQLYDGTSFYPVDATALLALDYDAETGTFTEGLTVTGGTSGATGTLEHLVDNGTTGTLWLRAVTGTFQDNETITDSSTGSATSNGTVSTLAPAITGVTTSSLSHVSVYRNRLAFTERGSLNVWFLPVDSIGGAGIQVSLAGVFKRGGSVLLTASWSLDSGSGLDDKFVVISTEGEFAVYQGSDPSDADTWSIVGVYEMSPPLGKNATMRAGGDLLVGTEEGLIPISQAVAKDPAALGLAAVSRKIAPDWINDARERRSLPWEICKWPDRSMAIISNPVTGGDSITPPWCYIVNVETGAWCKRTGWNTRCLTLHNKFVYFGSNNGCVYQADITGEDDGEIYYAKAVLAWDHLGSVGFLKSVTSARAQFVTENAFTPQISVSVDYTVSVPTPPNVSADTASPGTWDVGLWDVAKWDTTGTPQPYNTRWVSVGLSGYVVAAQVQVSVGSVTTPSAELVIIDLLYETGEVML